MNQSSKQGVPKITKKPKRSPRTELEIAVEIAAQIDYWQGVVKKHNLKLQASKNIRDVVVGLRELHIYSCRDLIMGDVSDFMDCGFDRDAARKLTTIARNTPLRAIEEIKDY